MMTAKEVARVFEEIAPLATGISGDQMGFVHMRMRTTLNIDDGLLKRANHDRESHDSP